MVFITVNEFNISLSTSQKITKARDSITKLIPDIVLVCKAPDATYHHNAHYFNLQAPEGILKDGFRESYGIAVRDAVAAKFPGVNVCVAVHTQAEVIHNYGLSS